MQIEDAGNSDCRILRKQLHSDDLFIKGIIERCGYGYPRIVLLDPVRRDKGKKSLNFQAISNLMWLTCPYLNEKIHEIENRGIIKKISDLLKDDMFCREIMRHAHANFYFLRNAVYSKYVDKDDRKKPMEIFERGIGGIKDLTAIKCLHIHFCHYRVYKYNIAGDITNRMLDGKIDCKENLCKRGLS